MITIHDGNADAFASMVKLQAPHLCGTAPRQSVCGKTGYATPYAEVFDLIPQSQWSARHDAMVGKFARQRFYAANPIHQYQGPHPLCWQYSLAQHLECGRVLQGLPYKNLAPESISEVCGFKDTGFFCDRAVEWVSQHGMSGREFVPQYAVKESQWNPLYKNDALNCVALERFDLGMKDMEAECMTAFLSGFSIYIGYNWLSHAMCLMELQKKGNEFGFWTPNTWQPADAMLIFGKKKIPNEAFVVRQVTYAK